MQTDIDPRNLIGRKAFDRKGVKIGTIDEVYLDDATGHPEWAAIRTGLFSRDAFVPLGPSELEDGALRVPFERALIRDAPDFGVGRHLSPEQELQLFRHYGLDVAVSPPVPDHSFGRVAGGGTGTPDAEAPSPSARDELAGTDELS
ncbi:MULTISPECIES: PRC-barrel domain-containing protein [Streptomyces]|uniref:PRC-barrel domain-containing protein n=1 Tax=Streptomyces TaxID=1883 RepID=UPI00177FBF37|nr:MULTISPECIES: PRC-barrel domain-containing protein [Streptomyces]MDX3358474.1 PRC-barrel domain-containing protein [Streptomyces sp. ME02-6978.2a]WTI25777.1 PRC-barrel domain-containing protein [Streptomyces jietaisiensis]GHE30215.1 photosystem reaction center subunit H [Streptomyces griseoaurantiacus]